MNTFGNTEERKWNVKRMAKISVWLLVALFLVVPQFGPADTILAPVKLETPRDTMKTFMSAMNQYRISSKKRKKGGSGGKHGPCGPDVEFRCGSFCFATERRRECCPTVERSNRSSNRYRLQQNSTLKIKKGEAAWRLRNSEISINKVTTGDRTGQYLFTQWTVAQTPVYFAKVKHLPYLEGSGMGANYQEPWLERTVPPWARSKVVIFPNWQWIGLFVAIVLGLIIRRLRSINCRDHSQVELEGGSRLV